jgi:hypothetical protein
MKKHAPDAIDLLDADHLAVHALLQSYRDLVRTRAPALQRRTLAEEICLELTIHAKLEEELLYPAVRDALHDPQVVDGAEDQHVSQRELVGQILSTAPDDDLYDARVAVLGDYFERHVRAEREQVFNRALASRVDLQALARSIMVRREELRAVSDALREDAIASAQA